MEYTINQFEQKVSEFFGAPYAVATDCCTHAIELCLRMDLPITATCPSHTYLSVPMTFQKLNLDWFFTDDEWKDFYRIRGTRIIDAAVLWQKNSYIKDSLMCLSFQFRKHLSLGRGGAILCSTKEEYTWLKKASYDGRLISLPWAEQNIDTIGYHYYMTPETAQLGLAKIKDAIDAKPKKWSWKNYPNLKTMDVFK